MNAMPITLNSDPLAKSKASLDVMSRHAAMPFAPFEREQQGKSLGPSLVSVLPHGDPALVKFGSNYYRRALI
jgi:hypothetical protein